MSSEQAFTQSYPALASSVPRARHALAMFAHATGATTDQVEAVRLAVSEALTNAVLHGSGAPAAAVHVSAARTGPELWVSISDDGRGLETAGGSPGLGMGLALIAYVTDYFAMSKRSQGGTELRMRFGCNVRRRVGRLHAVGSAVPA